MEVLLECRDSPSIVPLSDDSVWVRILSWSDYSKWVLILTAANDDNDDDYNRVELR